jgi:hypothetical protein
VFVSRRLHGLLGGHEWRRCRRGDLQERQLAEVRVNVWIRRSGEGTGAQRKG